MAFILVFSYGHGAQRATDNAQVPTVHDWFRVNLPVFGSHVFDEAVTNT